MFKRLANRLSTGRAQVVQALDKPENLIPALMEELQALRLRVHRLEIASKEAAERMDTTDGALHKLRGQVHGGTQKSRRLGTDAIPHGDKESLREYVGIGAGRRFNHGDN